MRKSVEKFVLGQNKHFYFQVSFKIKIIMKCQQAGLSILGDECEGSLCKTR